MRLQLAVTDLALPFARKSVRIWLCERSVLSMQCEPHSNRSNSDSNPPPPPVGGIRMRRCSGVWCLGPWCLDCLGLPHLPLDVGCSPPSVRFLLRPKLAQKTFSCLGSLPLGGSRAAQRGRPKRPKTPPRRPKTAPRRAQYAPKTQTRTPKMPQDAPKSCQDAPKTRQDASKTP